MTKAIEIVLILSWFIIAFYFLHYEIRLSGLREALRRRKEAKAIIILVNQSVRPHVIVEQYPRFFKEEVTVSEFYQQYAIIYRIATESLLHLLYRILI